MAGKKRKTVPAERPATLDDVLKAVQHIGHRVAALETEREIAVGKTPPAPMPPDAWRPEDEAEFVPPTPPARQQGTIPVETALKPNMREYVRYIAWREGGVRGETWSEGDAVAYIVSRAWSVDFEYRSTRTGSSGPRSAFDPRHGVWAGARR